MLLCVNLNHCAHITLEKEHPRLWTHILLSPPWEPQQPYLEWAEPVSAIALDDGLIIVNA
jgi:hypothetical protein